MQRTLLALLAVLSASPILSSQPVKPTTTLAAETGNNTSAANAFTTTTNGDAGAANVSKLPIRSLLYSGSGSLVFAHVEPWWGKSSHISIGYSSKDPAQAQRQVADMTSRGIDGAVIDWYGPTSYEDAGFKTFLAQAEAQPGFAVVAEIEHGAVLWDSCYPGCTATTAVIQLATYVAQTFFPSPAYYQINGRPVLMEFAMEVLPTAVDWNAVAAAVPGNPIFIHRNKSGFSAPLSSGSFAWMDTPTTPPPGYDGSSYLSDFYKFATQHASTEYTWGSVFKGFNDTLASWGLDHLEETAVLLVSELVSNAVRYACTGLVLELGLEAHGRCLRMEVLDANPDPPLPRAPAVRPAGRCILTGLAWPAPWRAGRRQTG